MKKGLFLSLLLSLPATASDYQIHVLQPGDTLSEVLQSKGFEPLYGDQSWVDKTLKMNHLSKQDAKNIKKGYPIILPKKEEVIQAAAISDKISTGQSSTIRYGLIGNRISNHQKVMVNMDYFQQYADINATSANIRENFGVGVDVISQNDFSLAGMTFNPTSSFYVHTQNGVSVSNNSDITADFRPTWNVSTQLALRTDNSPVDFGPMLKYEEASMLEANNEDYLVRRDQFFWIGAFAKKQIEMNNLEFNLQADLSATTFSYNTNNLDEMYVVKTRFFGNVNLTRDYYLGAFLENNSYTNSSMDTNTLVGMRLSYNLK
jgi:hypothetical protein